MVRLFEPYFKNKEYICEPSKIKVFELVRGRGKSLDFLDADAILIGKIYENYKGS